VKTCNKCGAVKDESEFFKGKNSCKSCALSYARSYSKRPGVKSRRRDVQRSYRKRPEVKAKDIARRNNPDNKAKDLAYRIANRAKKRAYDSDPKNRARARDRQNTQERRSYSIDYYYMNRDHEISRARANFLRKKFNLKTEPEYVLEPINVALLDPAGFADILSRGDGPYS
jgi:hypothetical protein